MADEKGMTMNSLEDLKLVMWNIDHSGFAEIVSKFSENCLLLYNSCFLSVTVRVRIILTDQYRRTCTLTGCLTSNIAPDLMSWKLCAQRGSV